MEPDKRRWLVTGASGMLGADVVALLRRQGARVTPLTRHDLDITDPAQVVTRVRDVDVVVNCAAWTAVDDAERHEEQAFVVNALAPQLLARAAHAAGARMVHLSTDYVFSGDQRQSHSESAALDPRSAYGRTKAAGEWAVRAECPDHLIVRTAWLYGAHGPCFPKTMARLAAERAELTVVDDQVGQPTWTADLAELILRLVDAQAPAGIYHGTARGEVSWYGFAKEVVQALGRDPAMVRAVSSDEYPRLAPRPAYSVLGHDALRAAQIEPIGHWSERWDVAAAAVLP